jgi:hypothetical protein
MTAPVGYFPHMRRFNVNGKVKEFKREHALSMPNVSSLTCITVILAFKTF